ncbi:heterokaryon incompatibility protein-domain-containing protein [Biscogniauxia marginata]|nr:heterokaryon incompatibility protein-domain-containing protein [Biscogniauxia marginata]
MWLINTETLELEYLANYEKRSYAILSHTWEDEVSFQLFKDLNLARAMKGFDKIHKTAQLARDRNLGYAWVDTCCIDKSSSTELSEAINSMFKWYTDSNICFVHLSDLPSVDDLANIHLEADMSEIAMMRLKAFSRCRWFTRGWTLQELLAPDDVEFYDSKWNLYGMKRDLIPLLCSITKISPLILRKLSVFEDVPIACRMSWAAYRTTTRIEDMTYCLL